MSAQRRWVAFGFDAFMWAVAWLIAIFGALDAFSDEMLSGLVAALGILAIAALSAIWLPIRAGGVVLALGQKALREEVAVTFLEPRDYIKGRLWPAVLRALIPAMTALPFLGVATLIGSSPPAEADVIIVLWAFVMLIAMGLAIALWGCIDWLFRLTRAGGRGGSLTYVPVLWSLAAIGTPAGLVWLVIGVFEMDGSTGSVFLIMLSLTVLYPLVKRWNSLVSGYFDFE